MAYVTLNFSDKIEANQFDTEAEARAYCRQRHYSLHIIFEGIIDEVYLEDKFSAPIAVYTHGKGYNCVPVEKDVPYTTYRVIRERLPAAPGFEAIVVTKDEAYSEVHDRIETSLDKGTRLLWVLYDESQMIEVRSADDRTRGRMLIDHNTIDGGDVIPGFSVSVKDLFEEITVE